MAMFWIGVGITLIALVVLRPAYREYMLGRHLTRLTSIVEEIESNRLIGLTSDETPFRQRFLRDQEWEKAVAFIRRYPAERITRELLKNSLICRSLGRNLRESSIYALIDILNRDGIALTPAELVSYQSHGHA